MYSNGNHPPPYNSTAQPMNPQLCTIAQAPQMDFAINGSQPQLQQSPNVVVVNSSAGGNCPACRVGLLTRGYTIGGVCLAIFCFPIGILCCMGMRSLQCSSCNYSV